LGHAMSLSSAEDMKRPNGWYLIFKKKSASCSLGIVNDISDQRLNFYLH